MGLGYCGSLCSRPKSLTLYSWIGQLRFLLGFHGMLEYWLKLQVLWTYLALTLDVSLLGVQRACIATDALKTRVSKPRPLLCEVQVALSSVASSQLMGDHDSEIGKFLQVCSSVATISCCRLCRSVPVFSFRVRTRWFRTACTRFASKVFLGGHCYSSFCRWPCGRCRLH